VSHRDGGRRRIRAFVVLMFALMAAAPAAASAETVRTTIHIPGMVVDNLCNGEPVFLSGDLHVETTTYRTRRGGFIVRSSTRAHNLRGEGLVTQLPYRGDEGENTRGYYAPPPQPSYQSVVHWTKLWPDGPAPSMYLVIALRQTIAADGTVIPTLESMRLTCREPCRKRGGRH